MADYRLSPELALTHPGEFKNSVLDHLGIRSPLGACAWNLAVAGDMASYDSLTLNPSTWVSNSVKDEIILGTAPMDRHMRQRLLFQDQTFSYADEVAYRLNHEVHHGIMFLKQHEPAVNALLGLNVDMRRMQGRIGFTALGSLDYYQGAEKKGIEDTTELLAMYDWDPNYFSEYTEFLGDSRYSELREEIGLATVDEPEPLIELVRAASAQAIEA